MLQLASNLESIAQIEPFLHHVCQAYAIEPGRFGDMLVTLTEAVSNAIRHGNRLDTSKKVNVLYHRKDKTLAFQISDEGDGFDYLSIPDPTAPERRMECGGRGVFIMKHLSDDLYFHDGGRTVEIRFHI